MIEQDVRIGTASGTMHAFTVRPDSDGPHAPPTTLKPPKPASRKCARCL